MTGLLPLVLVGATLAGVGCGGDEPAPDESVADASGASGAVSGMMELDLETTITSAAHEESESWTASTRLTAPVPRICAPCSLTFGDRPRCSGCHRLPW